MKPKTFSVILLAGGTGSRMKSTKPKQVLSLKEKPIILHSLDVFLAMPETKEVIVVCDPSLRHYFDTYATLKWALPGPRRQDSAYNGLQEVSSTSAYVCIHDACRPFINENLVRRTFSAALDYGAAAAAMPLRFTVKEINPAGIVVSTPDRNFFWEVQTPQILKKQLLTDGFEKAYRDNLTVTDDTSLAELVGGTVKLVEGAYSNLKITTMDDLAAAEIFANLDTPLPTLGEG